MEQCPLRKRSGQQSAPDLQETHLPKFPSKESTQIKGLLSLTWSCSSKARTIKWMHQSGTCTALASL
eukprot:3260636-Amphidinium_carterae.1